MRLALHSCAIRVEPLCTQAVSGANPTPTRDRTVSIPFDRGVKDPGAAEKHSCAPAECRAVSATSRVLGVTRLL